MKFILGKKLGMTQIWQEDEVVPVTRVKVGPCVVVQVKSEENDGYRAVQVGFGVRKEKNINKPQINHMKPAGGSFRYLREFKIDDKIGLTGAELKTGDIIDVDTFVPGDKVKVTGVSKGKGFQGVVKKYGFHGHNKTHGTKDQVRMPGSAGATGPAHVFKGMRMPGRMGNEQVTTSNLKVVSVDNDKNILLIKGAIPGVNNGLVMIYGAGEIKIKIESKKTENKAPEEKGKDKIKEAQSEVLNNETLREKKNSENILEKNLENQQ